MNILLITHQGDMAGSTNSISYLAKGLASRGHNVFLACRQESLIFQLLKDSKATAVPMQFKGKFDFANAKEIARFCANNAIDIVNAQSSWDRYGAGLAKLFYGLKAPIIHTRRQMPKSSGLFIQNWFYLLTAKEFVAVSTQVKDGLEKLGIPSARIKVIENGTPSEKYVLPKIEDEQQRLRIKYNITPSDVVIGCVSRLKEQVQLLLSLAHVQTSVTVLFVGIEETDDLKDASKGLERHRIIYVGAVSSEEVLYYYKVFSVKVLPSTMEGLSQSLLEAMALGVPVIATAFAGNIDLIEDGENGLLYENNNIRQLASQIEKIIESEKLAHKLIQGGHVTAFQKFSIENTVTKYEQFFAELIER